MAMSSRGEEKKKGCVFVAGNFQAASNKEVFEEIRKTTIAVSKVVFCLPLAHDLSLQTAQTLGLTKSRGDPLYNAWY